MKNQFIPKKILTLLLAVALLVSPIIAGKVNAAEAPSANTVSTYNYFDNVYPDLNDQNHVFKTATYEDIIHLFESEGTYAVLIGGAWSDNTQTSISYINEVAKQLGVSTIYNFDTKLDGDTLQIADTNNQFAFKYVDLVNKYLTNLSLYDKNDSSHNVSYINEKGEKVIANKLEAPFLFVYNKDNKDAQGNLAPIVSYLDKSNSKNDFLTNGAVDPAKVKAYKALLSPVFSAVTKYDTIDESAFIKAAFNKNYGAENPGKPTIFTETDGPLVYEHVTYHQLKQILASEGNYPILFGGSWCPNTQAVIKYINAYAKTNKISKIYFFDTKLDSGVTVAEPKNNPSNNPHATETLQIRDSKNLYAKLYVDLVNTYLTNIKTQNNTAEKPTVISYTDSLGKTVNGDRLQVPYFFTYNKDNKDADGNRAPILGHIELMYSWTNIQPDYAEVKLPDYPVGARYNNITKALSEIFTRLEAVPTGLHGLAPTSAKGNDGQITGTANKSLEYKLIGNTEYTPVTGEAITGLTPGTYKVRYAAIAGYQGPTTAEGATKITYNAGASIDIVVPVYGEQIKPVTFSDVLDTAWYSKAISFLVTKKITSGTDATHFSPNATVTRGQFIVLLFKAYGIAPESNGADNFTDAGHTYYTNYLAAAKHLGVAAGVGANQFKPDSPITRQELLTLLHHSLEVLGKLPTDKTNATVSSFSDAGQIPAYAQGAFKTLVESGIVTGNNGKLSPQGVSTRAQTAQLIYNLLSK
ncbi:MAG: S-layer homology domain-containing protein [Gorillibacterium sp.]|nr:S-layer homology domain-containing protein [Gorillibacterium sp.]